MGARKRAAGAWHAALLALLAVSCGKTPREQHAELPRERYPIVLVVVDTLRADHLGCYGYERPTSPRIDAFAEDVVRFDRCLAQSTWTKPTTASIHTGLYPSRHGATTVRSILDGSVETLAEVLSAQGYRCGAFGFNPHIFGPTGFEQGFATFEGLPAAPLPRADARAEEIVGRALEWLEGVRGEPYFLYVHLFDPHAPYDPPEPFRSRFDTGARGEHDAYYMMQVDVYAKDLSAADRRHYIDLYDAEIAYTDEQVGRLLDALDLDRTAVFLIADHGEELFDHGGWSHTPTMFQELLHVPLIASFPPLRSGRAASSKVRGAVTSDLALQVDVLPTVRDLIGLAPDERLPGTSLVAKALGAAAPTELAFSEADEFPIYKKAVVADQLKYVRTWNPEAGEVIYDLAADPREERDVLNEHLEEWTELRASLDAHVRGAPARYAFRFENRGPKMVTVLGYLVTELDHALGSSLMRCELHNEGAADWDGPFLFEEHEIDGRALKAVRFTLRTAPGDSDGLLFSTTQHEKQLEIMLRVDGEPIDLAYVHVGAAGAAPAALPIVLDLTDPERYASAGPGSANEPAEGSAPYHAWIWRNLDAAGGEAELSAEQIDALQKVGYLGGH